MRRFNFKVTWTLVFNRQRSLLFIFSFRSSASFRIQNKIKRAQALRLLECAIVSFKFIVSGAFSQRERESRARKKVISSELDAVTFRF